MSEHSRPLQLEYDRHTILLLMITLAKRKKMQRKKLNSTVNILVVTGNKNDHDL